MMAGGTPIQQMVANYAIDRSTMMATDQYPEAWASSEGFAPREGIVLSWPSTPSRRTTRAGATTT